MFPSVYLKSYIWKQFLLSRLGFRPNDSIWVAAHAVQYPLGPSKVFFPSSLHFCSTSAPFTFHQLPALCSSYRLLLSSTRSLPSALGSPLHKKIKLAPSYPVIPFLEEQRNENKCHPSHIYNQEPAPFSVLLTKRQCRQESFMTIIGRTTLEHTSLSASGAISYALCENLKGWHSSGQTVFQNNTNLFCSLAQSALRASGNRLNDTTDLSSTDSSPTNAELSIHEEISKV